MQMQLPMDGLEPAQTPARAVETSGSKVDPHEYDHVIVAFSGGKDSAACVLKLIEAGVRPELWHHDVDGGPDDDPLLRWDWPVTRSYCRKFAEALGLDIFFSWRVGGLTGELLKENDRTKPVRFEKPDGIGEAGGKNGTIATRRRWPALQADLRVRWCSASAKVDVMAAAIAGQERFRGKRILVVTGERAEESANRAKYKVLEPHRTHQPGPRARRHVDHWRPILQWTEEQVWDIIRRHGIVPHPCYFLGFGRASCMICIYLGKDELATVRAIDPLKLQTIAALETEFGCTIKRRDPITAHASAGRAFDFDPEAARMALAHEYAGEILVSPDRWSLPKGAYRRGGGPS